MTKLETTNETRDIPLNMAFNFHDENLMTPKSKHDLYESLKDEI
jgi:hypothetical protein